MSLIDHTAEIVKAYLSRNEVPPQHLAEVIEMVHQTLMALSRDPVVPSEEKPSLPSPPDEAESPVFVPFVPIEQAVTEESVICLICGKAGQSMRGHLTKTHGVDIPTYLARYGLPKDFPLVAPAFSAVRRQLAIAAGAGEKLQAGRERKAPRER